MIIDDEEFDKRLEEFKKSKAMSLIDDHDMALLWLAIRKPSTIENVTGYEDIYLKHVKY